MVQFLLLLKVEEDLIFAVRNSLIPKVDDAANKIDADSSYGQSNQIHDDRQRVSPDINHKPNQ